MVDIEFMELDFVNWIQAELDKRGWTPTELGRRGHISDAQMSRVMSGTRSAGLDFLRGVARGLGVPLEYVFRQAGWLPNHSEMLPEAREWSARLLALTDGDRTRAISMVEQVLHFAEDRPQYRARRNRSTP